MVRKRSRTSRKHYDSDDNDSDSDFSLEDPRSQPAPKKYSLRQRKKALFIDDYDYEDDDEILPIPPTNAHSDDEDFDVEREVSAPNNEYDANLTYTNTDNYEDPSDDPNGLIDFEDMIRADIVVNKNRIDYDNMIDKTEITIQPNKSKLVPPVKSKRGRKPKKRPETEIGSILLEPQAEVQEEFVKKTDTDYIIKETVQNTEDYLSNETKCSVDNQISETKEENELKNEETQPLTHILMPQNEETDNGEQLNTDAQESVIKFNESCISKSIHVNGTVLTTETSESSEAKDDSIQLNAESDDDDDVVFVEDKRSEIIVLDD